MSVPEHRCAACGVRRGTTYAVDPDTRALRRVIIACDTHPDSPAVSWSGTHQAAAVWVSQYLMGGRSWEDVEATVAGAENGNRKRALLAVIPLLRRWGGELPERRIPAHAADHNPLFEGSRQ